MEQRTLGNESPYTQTTEPNITAEHLTKGKDQKKATERKGGTERGKSSRGGTRSTVLKEECQQKLGAQRTGRDWEAIQYGQWAQPWSL